MKFSGHCRNKIIIIITGFSFSFHVRCDGKRSLLLAYIYNVSRRSQLHADVLEIIFFYLFSIFVSKNK